MNDNTKVLDQNPSTPQVPIQPVPGVGGTNKEAVRPVVAPVSEFVRPSGAETVLNIPPEVSEVNVAEVKSDRPNLTFEHKDLVDHAGPHVPVKTSPTSNVRLPMTEEEIANQLKGGQDDNSGKWLAGLIQKVIRAMGL